MPFTPGAELADTIVDASQSNLFEEGQMVIATPSLPDGAYSQYVNVNAVFPIPASMSWQEAASMFIIYHTGYYALKQCTRLKEGETLLVHAGSGGIGSAAIQLGKVLGATVIATAGNDEKVEVCKKIGIDYAINYQEGDFVKKVKKITNGKGVDVIYDPVGGEVFHCSRKCIAFDGRILIVGFAGGEIPSAPANHILVKNYSLVGVHWGYFRKLYPEKVFENHEQLMSLYQNGLIKPLIYKEYTFEQLPTALDELAERKTWGKIVLKLS
ncbi:NADPH:quinone oxidoreductase family protein [Oceanobacillus salinisoli]|uniref:NADPH:quinone oxidoreductase family protein n=1 Tax=Oceanobacillus salinisoli TaxID=2678611 RepID=UPI001E2C78EB|nr:NADPH:quinone oxidoreductase family protein [Oceanobacillus salinisoli]